MLNLFHTCFFSKFFNPGREAKQEASGAFEASPKEPLVITVISSTNSDADTDLDSVSSIDQAINSHNSGLTILY